MTADEKVPFFPFLSEVEVWQWVEANPERVNQGQLGRHATDPRYPFVKKPAHGLVAAG